ncbi:MAG: DegT/DnrJ/EryC1/StrS family aminotransferase [Anaerolineaceae bacterium]|nr:DegT/DnrJ/EryC1/StrS family aminotransferase [Anaerolineaceae bacterium]
MVAGKAKSRLTEKLAIHGGPKAKKTPYRKGRRFGRDELKELKEALDQNTLFYAHGTKVKQFCAELAAKYGKKYAVATTSGTAAIHVALGALGVGPGDEVITSVLTDAGGFIPVLYQNAVPIFTDIDPRTYNMTAQTIAARITPRTKAILVVHLAGNAADLTPILKLARRKKIYVIEDCAQSWNCFYKGCPVGTMGHIGCYSLNDYKHLSVGDGGAILTDNLRLARRAALFADKCYSRNMWGKRTGRGSQFLAPNYRMSELSGAVALAQLRKVDWICWQRNKFGKLLTEMITDLPGILPPEITPGCESSNWFYMLRIEPQTLGVSRNEFMAALQAEGLPAGFYLQRVDQSELFRKMNIYPSPKKGFVCPFDCPAYGGKRPGYRRSDCPKVELVMKTGVIIQMSEFYRRQDIVETGLAIGKVAAYYAARKQSRKRPGGRK